MKLYKNLLNLVAQTYINLVICFDASISQFYGVILFDRLVCCIFHVLVLQIRENIEGLQLYYRKLQIWIEIFENTKKFDIVWHFMTLHTKIR